MALTKDDKYLFIANNKGSLRQYDLKQKYQKLVMEYSYLCDTGFISIKLTNDNNHLFIGGDYEGKLKHFSLTKNAIEIENCIKIYDNDCTSFCITNNSKYLFIGFWNGFLIQFYVKTGIRVKNYGIVMECSLTSMFITSDDKQLFVGGYDGYLSQIDIKKQKLVKNYCKIHNDSLNLIHC